MTIETPEPTALTFQFERVLSDDEQATLRGIIETWNERQRIIREGFPGQHARHVKAKEADPVTCGDCTRGIVSQMGLERLLVCSRLHGLPLKVKHCHVDRCVIECGEPD